MADKLFEGLPPPSVKPTPTAPVADQQRSDAPREPSPSPAPLLKSALKTILKREKPLQQQTQEAGATASKKRLRFKTTIDASEKQVIEAMQKIAFHIVNPSKFSKASKLAIQLIQAGSVKDGISDHFLAIFEAAMLFAHSLCLSLPKGRLSCLVHSSPRCC